MSRPSPVRILATAEHRPGETISNERLAELLGGKDVPLACRFSGVRGRHWAVDPETGWLDPTRTNSALVIRAGRAALERAGIAPDEVDLVICATCTPELLLPQTSALVQTGLRIPDCRCIDLRAGCAGVVSALDLARHLIQSGSVRHALVAGSDCFSPLAWPRLQDPATRSMDDVHDAAMLSDAAAAAVLGRGEPGEPGTLGFAASGSPLPDTPPGLATEPLVPRESLPFEWAPRRKLVRPPRVSTRHPLIAEHLPRLVQTAVERLEREAGLEWPAFGAVIGPQANPNLTRQTIQKVSEALTGETRPDPRRPFTIGDRIGNCPGAAVLQAYHLLLEEDPPPAGSAVALLGIESPRWTYSLLVLHH